MRNPQRRTIHGITIAASLLGFLLKSLFGGQPLWALVLGGASLALAGLCVLAVPRLAAQEARA